MLLAFLCSLGVSLLLTFSVREGTRRLGWLDRPGEHKQHAEATATLGGLPVFVAFVVGCALAGPVPEEIRNVLEACGLLMAIGLLDDVRGVPATIKLGSLMMATAWLGLGGIHLDTFGWSDVPAGVLTFFWIGLVSSAFNGVDNHDGAAGGLAAISAFAVFAISQATHQTHLAGCSLMLGSACLGFLKFNFPLPRASIFLGDCGSLFLGFGLAVLTVLGQWSTIGWKSAVVAVLLVLVPLYDFLFILITRGLDGRYRNWIVDPIKMCGRDHTAHRLRYLGLSPRQVLASLYGAGILAGLAAFAIVEDPSRLNPAVTFGALVFLLIIGRKLKSVPLPPDAFPE